MQQVSGSAIVVAPMRIRPEDELLLCCARSQLDAHIANRIMDLLRQDLDWPYLLQRAHRQKVLPLVYWHLHGLCPDAVPRLILEQLHDAFAANLGHSRFILTAELTHLLSLFAAEQIPAIPFKGPVLAQSLYGNLALRQSADLDLFVQQRDVARVRRLLLARGYRLSFPPAKSHEEAARLAAWSDAQEAGYLTLVDAQHFANDDLGLEVDLHWSLAPRWFVALDHAGMWQRLQPVSVCGTEVQALGPEDLLMVLCVEGVKDGWSSLHRICDIATLVQTHPDVDWNRVLCQARARGGARMLLLGLCLAQTLLATPLPPEVMERWQADRVTLALASQAREWLFPDPDGMHTGPPSYVRLSLYHLRAHERWRDRLRFCWHRAVTPSHRDWALLRLPPSIAFLYYPLRPVRLLWAYGARGARQVVTTLAGPRSGL